MRIKDLNNLNNPGPILISEEYTPIFRKRRLNQMTVNTVDP